MPKRKQGDHVDSIQQQRVKRKALGALATIAGQGYNCRNFRKILLHMCQQYEFKMPHVRSAKQNDGGYTSSVVVQLPGIKNEVTFAVSAQTKKLAKISAYAEAVAAFKKAHLLRYPSPQLTLTMFLSVPVH